MKKRNLRSLQLNKKSISNLNPETVKGGLSTICLVVASALVCTRWDGCDLPTIGSGDGSGCISTDGGSLCGGR